MGWATRIQRRIMSQHLKYSDKGFSLKVENAAAQTYVLHTDMDIYAQIHINPFQITFNCVCWCLNLYTPTHEIKSGSSVLCRCCVHCRPGRLDKKPRLPSCLYTLRTMLTFAQVVAYHVHITCSWPDFRVERWRGWRWIYRPEGCKASDHSTRRRSNICKCVNYWIWKIPVVFVETKPAVFKDTLFKLFLTKLFLFLNLTRG